MIKTDYETGIIEGARSVAPEAQWAIRHNNAWDLQRSMVSVERVKDEWRAEQAVAAACHALKVYANSHKLRFDSKLADDYVLGPAWLAMLQGVRTLLDGETGRLDCGTVDGYLVKLAEDNGFKQEDL